MAISSQIHEPGNCPEFSNGRHFIPFSSVNSLVKEKLHTFAGFVYITPTSKNEKRWRLFRVTWSLINHVFMIVGSRRTSCGCPLLAQLLYQFS